MRARIKIVLLTVCPPTVPFSVELTTPDAELRRPDEVDVPVDEDAIELEEKVVVMELEVVVEVVRSGVVVVDEEVVDEVVVLEVDVLIAEPVQVHAAVVPLTRVVVTKIELAVGVPAPLCGGAVQAHTKSELSVVLLTVTVTGLIDDVVEDDVVVAPALVVVVDVVDDLDVVVVTAAGARAAMDDRAPAMMPGNAKENINGMMAYRAID